ncbi:MAG TPA: hypothetical protein PK735_15460 [Flavobacteriales bacterium]|nr:hypothetical protein [Flavobacteriales bacterium]
MNATFTPSAKAIEKATKTIGSAVQLIGITKQNKASFVMSFVSVRMGLQSVCDYTFSNNTGRLLRTVLVERTYVG